MTARRSLVVVLAASMACLPSRRVCAQEALGLDASAVEGGRNAAWGFGVDGRAGYRTGPPRSWVEHTVFVQIEAIGGYRRLFVTPRDLEIGSFGGGLRLGALLGWFEPFLFSHLSAADVSGTWGPLLDVGGALDWRLRTFNVGLHYGHDWAMPFQGTELQLNEVGLHVEVRGFWL
jgi:hypothetical protein